MPHGRDGFECCPPIGDKASATQRPNRKTDALVALDKLFGLRAAISIIPPLYNQKYSALTGSAGSPNTTRTRLAAKHHVSSGTPGSGGTRHGRLHRALQKRLWS